MRISNTLIFRTLEILVLGFILASCTAMGPSKKEAPTELQAKLPERREIIIPLDKVKPEKSNLPDSITQIQPNLDLKEQEVKGFRFTMSARGVNIKNVLFALSQEIDQNIIIDPDIDKPGVGKLATVDLKNVTLEEALESLLTPLHLKYELDDKYIRVTRQTMEARTFYLNYIISKRRGSSNLSSKSGGGTNSGGSTSSSNSSTTTASTGASLGSSQTGSTSSIQSSEETDIWSSIFAGLSAMVTQSGTTIDPATPATGESSEAPTDSGDPTSSTDDPSGLVSSLLGGGNPSSAPAGTTEGSDAKAGSRDNQSFRETSYVIVNRQAGIITVKDYPDVLLRVAEFLENIEGSVQRQVFIQAKIIEVTLNDDYRLGIDWKQVSPFTIGKTAGSILANTTTITGSAGFVFGPSSSAFNVVVDALSEQGQVSVLSSPKIATLNNQRAVIKVGTEDIFFIPEITPATTTSAATTEFIPSTITIGIVLDVVPQINPNGEIMMSINTSITEKAGERTSPDGVNVVPILDVREANNVVIAQHGQTIIIGGLMKTKKEVDDNSVPFLGAIPGVGRLFHWDQENVLKSELVIMLTPEIMAGRAVDDRFVKERDRLRNTGYDIYSDTIANPSFKR